MSYLRFEETTDAAIPTPPSGKNTIYVDSSTGLASMKDDAGVITRFGVFSVAASPEKTTPVNADNIPLANSEAGNALYRLTWANLKATLKTYFDTLYAAAGVVTGFTSTDQTITAAGSLTIAHGLGVAPKRIAWALVCQTADQNYTAGDVVFYPLNNTGTNQGVVIVPDATNLNVRFGSSATVFQIINKTTGAANNITLANWKIRFYASTVI